MIKNKKILYIAHTDFVNDGRTQSIVKELIKLNEVTVYSKGKNNKKFNSLEINYSLKKIIFIFKNLKKDIDRNSIVFIDNRKSCLWGLLFLKKILKKTLIVDSREFYTLKEAKSIYNFVGTIIEGLIIKKAKFVIVANNQRAELTKNYFNLKRMPFVFENRRKLPEKSVCENSIISNENKIINLNEKRLNLISTSGFSIERNSKLLLDAAKENEELCNIYFIGKSTKKDKEFYKNYINNNNINNVYSLKPIAFNELKGFIKLFDVGIVNYSQKNLNNKYCASGKIYEYLECGLPVITTNNPTLIEVINKHKCGIASNDFSQSIKEINKEIKKFKNNVLKFDSINEIEKYNENTINKILCDLV